ncbi:nucleotide-diphospho-sugar transferase, partial [Cladochytrium replicatum]
IPRIIHQSWKTKNLPPRFKTWSHSWKKKNPGWKYNLWTDETNREMVARHFPWFLPVYDGLPRNICRADVSRYMYMFAFGGVYADLDRGEVETHNATTTTLELLLPFMGFDFRSEHNVPNAWMASRPGHPFWIHCLMVVEARYRILNVEKMTGPVLLIDAYRDYMVRMPQELREPIFFLEPGVIFPFDWHDVPKHVYEICCAALDTFDPERCKALYNSTTAAREKAWTITYWSHSW